MDASDFHTAKAIMATTPANETGPDARLRHTAIVEMIDALEPRNAQERAIVCNYVIFWFMLQDAIRAFHLPDLEGSRLNRARVHVLAMNRAAQKWLAELRLMRKPVRTVKLVSAVKPLMPVTPLTPVTKPSVGGPEPSIKISDLAARLGSLPSLSALLAGNNAKGSTIPPIFAARPPTAGSGAAMR